jgi:hypothetical protein
LYPSENNNNLISPKSFKHYQEEIHFGLSKRNLSVSFR